MIYRPFGTFALPKHKHRGLSKRLNLSIFNFQLLNILIQLFNYSVIQLFTSLHLP